MVSFSDFDKLFNLILNEADKYFNEKLVDEQDYSKERNVVDTPVLEVCKCEENGGCCGNCSCTKDINKNEDYTNSITTKDYENTPLTTTYCGTPYNQLVDKCEDSQTKLCCPKTDNGWWEDGHGNLRTDVYAPVDNQHTEVNILDCERVQVSYEQSNRIDGTNMSGYSHQSGSYVFPLPEDANLSTFKARRSGSYIELTVSPRSKIFDGSCVKVDIQD